MIAILDAAYGERASAGACVLARAWEDGAPSAESVARGGPPAPYEPGAFYTRELPLLLAALAQAGAAAETLVVDGYVHLDASGRPGLGAYLSAALGGVAVVGIAKTAFRGTEHSAAPVTRGSSRQPLFVTAHGMSLVEAADAVRRMHGPHRIPTLLARVDALARATLAGA